MQFSRPAHLRIPNKTTSLVFHSASSAPLRFILLGTLVLQSAARAEEQYAPLLAKECDALLADVVKRPYGWAWPDPQAADAAQKRPGRPVSVSLQPRETPATALLLWYAGELLNQPKYTDAARNVARGIAAAQTPSGKFPANALFGNASAISKERSAPLPDRASTRASLALLLTVIDGAGDDQELLKRAANRGVKWLLKQQTEPGGWPTLYPPGAEPKDAVRIVRLDTPDCRDDVYTMLLASEVLGDPFHRRAAERSIEFLIKTRSGVEDSFGAGLWQSAYTMPGLHIEKIPAFPEGFDLLASRYAVQATFGAWLILGDDQRLTACQVATNSIDKLIQNDGQWHRRFDDKGKSLDPDDGKSHQFFGNPDAPPEPETDPVLAQTAQSVALAKQLGRDKLRDQINTRSTPRARLAMIITGLADDLLDTSEPQAAMKQADAQLRLLEKSDEPDDRLKRLWTLYRLTNLEKLDDH